VEWIKFETNLLCNYIVNVPIMQDGGAPGFFFLQVFNQLINFAWVARHVRCISASKLHPVESREFSLLLFH